MLRVWMDKRRLRRRIKEERAKAAGLTMRAIDMGVRGASVNTVSFMLEQARSYTNRADIFQENLDKLEGK